MPISVKIANFVNVGSGTSYHTDYRMDVVINDRRWTVYRRYSAFEQLHLSLVKDLGEEVMTVKFPDKVYVGSYAATLKAFTEDRMVKLQQYLDSILIVEDIVENSHLTTFLDCDHLGLSGLVKELGAERVMREAFVETRITKNLPAALGLWCNRFVVILSSGSIVVLNSVYDDSNKALLRMALVNGQTTVVPQASGNIINITTTLDKTKLSLSFPTAADSVFWLRKLSDFVLNTQFTEDHQRGVAEAKKQAQAKEKANKEAYVAANTVHVRAKGTGQTEDELSATLGI
jgi:hypothetical protein